MCACADTSALAPTAGTYWTSGTDKGLPGSFAWCSARKLFYKSKWAPGQPAASAQAQCVAVRLDAMTAQLETADCAGVANKFICEVRVFLIYALINIVVIHIVKTIICFIGKCYSL